MLTGIPRTTISATESGKALPSVDYALKLAKALGCTVEELFSPEEEPITFEAFKEGPFISAKVSNKEVLYPASFMPPDGFYSEGRIQRFNKSPLPFWLTLKLAFWTTLILLIMGIALSYYLAYTKHRINTLLEAVISLPLVLPPTVLGFYLLLFFNKKGFLGYLWYKLFGKQLVFHFEGIVLASIIYSMPMMIHPLTAGFRSVPRDLIEASWTLGKSKKGCGFCFPRLRSLSQYECF